MRQSTWCGRSEQRSYRRKAWAELLPIGPTSQGASQNPSGGKNESSAAILSKRLWGGPPGPP